MFSPEYNYSFMALSWLSHTVRVFVCVPEHVRMYTCMFVCASVSYLDHNWHCSGVIAALGSGLNPSGAQGLYEMSDVDRSWVGRLQGKHPACCTIALAISN